MLNKESFLLIVFLLNPILGICLCVSLALSGQNRRLCLPLIFACSLYMAAINTTKEIAGDEIVYVDHFKQVPQNGYVKTLSHLNPDGTVEEPVYGTLVYVLYYITFGSPMMFIALITFVTYVVFLLAIYRLEKKYRTPNYIIVVSIITLVSFTQFFFLTAHLIRQFLATSFFFLALSYKGDSLKKYVLFCFVSFSIHMSMASLIFISLIPQLNKLLNKKGLVIAAVVTVILSTVFPILAGSLLSSFAIAGDANTLLERASQAEGMDDGSGSLSPFLLLIVCAPLVIISVLGIIKRRIYLPGIVYNLCLIWCLFVLSLSFSPLIQYRFFFVLYFFIPIMLFLVFREKMLLSKCYCTIICIFFVFRFFVTYNEGGFHYAPISDIIFMPYPMLINF